MTAPEELAALVERLRERADEDRTCAANSAVVRDLLQPQLDAFNVRDGSHNTYAVRLQLDHRNSAKRDSAYADDLEAAIAHLSATDNRAPVEDGWRTMESAPRDGTRFLAYMPNETGGRAFQAVVWWDEEFAADDWDEDANKFMFTGAWTSGRVASFGMEEYAAELPTHWQPLPASPQQETRS